MKMSYLFKRIEEEVFKRLHIVRFYSKAVGLKNTNASILISYSHSSGNIHTIDSSKLHLGPDYLKDQYTLLDCPITESPHVGFMAALMNGKPIKETDYIRRFLNGTLDWRSPLIMPKDKMRFQKKFERSLSEIQSGEYPPAVVYLQGGKYYIYDGKHRAALCALLGRPVRCMVIENDIVHTNVWNYMFQLIDGKKEYQLHNYFHKAFLKENECKD